MSHLSIITSQCLLEDCRKSGRDITVRTNTSTVRARNITEPFFQILYAIMARQDASPQRTDLNADLIWRYAPLDTSRHICDGKLAINLLRHNLLHHKENHSAVRVREWTVRLPQSIRQPTVVLKFQNAETAPRRKADFQEMQAFDVRGVLP